MEAMLYNIPETAQSLGIGRTSVYKLIKQGRLQKVKINNCTRVTVSSVVALVQAGAGAK